MIYFLLSLSELASGRSGVDSRGSAEVASARSTTSISVERWTVFSQLCIWLARLHHSPVGVAQ